MYQPSQLTSLYGKPDYKYHPPSKRIGHSELMYHYPRQIYPPQKSILSTKSLLSYTHHLETERNHLFSQLSEEKLSNNKSKAIIDDLITSSKNRNIDNIGIYGGEVHNKSKGNRSSYSEGRFKEENEEKETQQKRGSEKGEREKASKCFLRGNEKEKNNVEILGKIEETGKIKSLQNEELRIPTINSSLYQNKIHSSITNNTKSAIFRKLYIESFHESNQQKTLIKEETQTQSSIKEEPICEQIFVESAYENSNEEIRILKEQLEEKNRMIINLQCELLKHSENVNKSENINCSIKSIETAATINDYQSSETGLSTKIKCSLNPACVSLTIPEEKRIEEENKKKRFSLCEKMCMSINKENEKVLDNKKIEPDRINFHESSRDLGRESISNSFINSFESKPEKSYQALELNNNSASIVLNQQIYNLLILPIKITQEESTKTQTSIKTQEETYTHTERFIEEEKESKKNMETQTSECYYDYIEETYLEWMFDKEYEEMQRIKQEKQNKK